MLRIATTTLLSCLLIALVASPAFGQTIDLSLAKEVDNAAPDLNDDVVFTLTLTNDGLDEATNVVVEDVLPAGLVYVSDNGGGNTEEVGGTVTWTIPSLPGTSSTTLEITATVTTADEVINVAQVTAADQDDSDSTPNDGAGDDYATEVVNAIGIDLSLTKTVDDDAPSLDDIITFTLTLTNDGPDDATGIEVTDILPAGLDYISDNGGGNTSELLGTVTWSIPSLASGASTTLEIEARVETLDPVTNTAEVTAADQVDVDSEPGDGPGDDDYATATVDALEIDLELEKTVDDAVPYLGDNVTFTLTLTNNGPDTATNIEVEDVLPAGLTYVSDNGGGSTSESGGTVTWTVSSLANGADISLQIVATAVSALAVTNRAQVTAADQRDLDSTPDNDDGDQSEDDEAAVGVNAQAADLELSKVVDDAAPNLGDNVVFTLTLRNDGPDTATNIEVEDILPPGLVYVSDNGGGETIESGGTITWTIASLANDSEVTLEITATANDLDPVTNTAQVVAVDQPDTDSEPDDDMGDDFASATVDAVEADLELRKWADRYRPNLGETVNFTVRLINLGPDVSTGVVVEDDLPAGLTFSSASTTQGTYDEATGLWDVGDIAAEDTVYLHVTARVDVSGEISNMARVFDAPTIDPDSEPGNDDIAEDDQDTAVLNPIDPDGDGVPNTADRDDDGDGIIDQNEDRNPSAGKSAAMLALPSDVDSDGLPDGLDLDSDGDGIPDHIEAQAWTWAAGVNTLVDDDGDGVPFGCDPDDNTPGHYLFDPVIFAGCTVGYIPPSGVDANLNGIDDAYDPAMGGTAIVPVDTDGDGIPDYLDPDSDNDGIPDRIEAFDFDQDGIADVTPLGIDSDGDGIDDAYDTIHIPPSHPWNILASNFRLQDTDGNGIPDFRDEDDDGDAVLTKNEIPGGSPPHYLDDGATTALTDNADLALTKTVDDVSPLIGNQVTFTLELTNAGPGLANAIQVIDVVPPGLKNATYTASQGTYYVSLGLWDVGTLAAGGSATLELTATVTGSIVITNHAEVVHSSQGDPDSTPGNGLTNEDDFATITIIPREQTSFWHRANPAAGTAPALAFSTELAKAGASGTIFVGTDGGGIYRSVDGGDSWFPTGLAGAAVRAITLDDDEDIFAGTYGGDGVSISTDVGTSFSPANTGLTNKDVLSLIVNRFNDKDDTGDLFAGTDGDGVFFSDDKGASWTNVEPNLVVLSLAAKDNGAGANTDIIFAGTLGGGVYRFQYGGLWSQKNGTGLNVLAGAAKVVNDLSVDADGDVFAATNDGLYRSTDNGDNWTKVTLDLNKAVVAKSVITFTDGTDHILVGTAGDYIYRSTDDGATFTQIVRAAPNETPWWGLEGSTILTIIRDGDGNLFAGTEDFGVHRSTDNGATWNQVTDIAMVTVINDLTFNDAADVLYAASYGYGVLRSLDFDTATPTTNDPLSWFRINNGLTNHYVYSLLDYVRNSKEYLFAGTWQDGIFRTTDGGENWLQVGLAGRIVYDMAHCPTNDRVFASTDRGQVARSVDNGLTWQEIGVATTAIWSLLVDPTDCNVIYAGTFGAGIFKSTDGGGIWTQTGMTSGYAFDFAFDPTGSISGGTRIYVATAVGVQYTDDAGTTWTDFSTGLTVRDTRSILFFETLGGDKILLAGTHGGGVFVYDIASSAWIRDGLPATPQVPIIAFAVHPSGEVIASAGDGALFRKEFPRPRASTVGTEEAVAEIPSSYELDQNYPNPFNPQTTIRFGLPEASSVRVSVYDLLGREVRVLVDGGLPAGRHEVVLDAGQLASGVYFYQLESQGRVMSRRMILMK